MNASYRIIKHTRWIHFYHYIYYTIYIHTDRRRDDQFSVVSCEWFVCILFRFITGVFVLFVSRDLTEVRHISRKFLIRFTIRIHICIYDEWYTYSESCISIHRSCQYICVCMLISTSSKHNMWLLCRSMFKYIYSLCWKFNDLLIEANSWILKEYITKTSFLPHKNWF